jgi:hypothetical protein
MKKLTGQIPAGGRCAERLFDAASGCPVDRIGARCLSPPLALPRRCWLGATPAELTCVAIRALARAACVPTKNNAGRVNANG